MTYKITKIEVKAKFKAHGIKCEAVCITNNYQRFLTGQVCQTGKQCRAMAEELTADRRPVCWTHARAAENKQRSVPLEFVGVIDASVLPELQP